VKKKKKKKKKRKRKTKKRETELGIEDYGMGNLKRRLICAHKPLKLFRIGGSPTEQKKI